MVSSLLNFREERDLGEKINATFAFIKQNIKTLGRYLLFLVTPFSLISGVFIGIFQSRRLTLIRGERDIEYGTYAEYDFYNLISSFSYLAGTFFTFLSFLLISLVCYAFITAYMDHEGQVDNGVVWSQVKENFLRVFFTSFGMFLLCLLGLVVLVVPGIYLSVALSFYLIVMLREDLSLVETVERCLYLIKGNWWSTLGLLLMVSFIQGVMAILVGFPAWVLQVLQVLQIPGADHDWLIIGAHALSSVLTIYLYVILIVALAFQYFHLVELKDGIGLLEQAELIGARATSLPANEGDF